MPITPDEAADIAQHHGLGLQDAAGLLTLCNDVDDAHRIAARFAAGSDAGALQATREALFGAPNPSDHPRNVLAVSKSGRGRKGHPKMERTEE